VDRRRHEKYHRFPSVPLHDRTWPDAAIGRAPRWCSVDLRDGNQALVEPMDAERKRRMFDLLVRIGFKEIEVGFPAASAIDFEFVRTLVNEDLIPPDVTIAVLTQAREELIERTFEAIAGAPRAIVHLYNSTSAVQRRVVFGLDRPGIKAIAQRGTQRVRELARECPSAIVLEYSPESFTGTELDFAVEVCAAVMDAWEPDPQEKIIINLPATVELATPNVYADQIELFARWLPHRDRAVLSVHPHNDRGTAVAAAELAVMAGAERIEGTLFGNGERTGNVDLMTLALNLFTQGVDPELDFGDLPAVVAAAEYCNRLPVHPRHPYAGELVFTAFSGSHQDAIRKGFAAHVEGPGTRWEVPYLPIDPKDIGRSYEAVVRINSQSGKGGVAYVLESDFGIKLPRSLQIEFSRIVQAYSERSGGEVTSIAIRRIFEANYLAPGRYALGTFETSGEGAHGSVAIDAQVTVAGQARRIGGSGNGPIAAFVDALARESGHAIEVADYSEHALGSGADAAAMAYVLARIDGVEVHGAGRATDIVSASIEAIVNALNRFVEMPAERKVRDAAVTR
jgi:2-isopropylmalate synthase